MMESGSLRHLIQILRPVRVRDGNGQVASGYEAVSSRMASIHPASVKNRFFGERGMIDRQYVMRMRHAEIDESMRIGWRMKQYEVLSVMHDPTFSRDVIVQVAEVDHGK